MRQTEKDKDRGRDLVERECEISTCKWQGGRQTNRQTHRERERKRRYEIQRNLLPSYRKNNRERKKGRKRINSMIYDKKR